MRRSTTKLTETMVARATHGTSKDGNPIAGKYWDSAATGLVLVVTPKGARSWYWKGDRNGKQIWINLGAPGAGGLSLEEAREEAGRLRKANKKGDDVKAQVKSERTPKTVGELAEVYRKKKLADLRDRTRKGIEAILDKEKIGIIACLGACSVKKLEKAQVVEYLDRFDKTPFQQKKVAGVIRAMLTLAGKRGWKIEHPDAVRELDLAKDNTRKVDLKPRELAAVEAAMVRLVAAKSLGLVAADAIRFLCFTGLRLNEALRLRWERDKRAEDGMSDPYVDLDAKTITLEWHKTSEEAGTKVLPLNPQALELLKARSGKSIHPFCFPGHVLMKPLVNLEKSWLKVRDEAGLGGKKKVKKVPRKGPEPGSKAPRLHDLRRTFYRAVVALTGLYDVADVLTGHKLPKIKDTYGSDQALMPTFVQASADAGAWIAAALAGENPAPGVKVGHQAQAQA